MRIYDGTVGEYMGIFPGGGAEYFCCFNKLVSKDPKMLLINVYTTPIPLTFIIHSLQLYGTVNIHTANTRKLWNGKTTL